MLRVKLQRGEELKLNDNNRLEKNSVVKSGRRDGNPSKYYNTRTLPMSGSKYCTKLEEKKRRDKKSLQDHIHPIQSSWSNARRC